MTSKISFNSPIDLAAKGIHAASNMGKGALKTAQDSAEKIVKAVQQNPKPAAIVAFGALSLTALYYTGRFDPLIQGAKTYLSNSSKETSYLWQQVKKIDSVLGNNMVLIDQISLCILIGGNVALAWWMVPSIPLPTPF